MTEAMKDYYCSCSYMYLLQWISTPGNPHPINSTPVVWTDEQKYTNLNLTYQRCREKTFLWWENMTGLKLSTIVSLKQNHCKLKVNLIPLAHYFLD